VLRVNFFRSESKPRRARKSRQKQSANVYIVEGQSMKHEPQSVISQSTGRLRPLRCTRFLPFIAFLFLALPATAHASIFHGETLDSIANGISWVVIQNKPNLKLASLVRLESDKQLTLSVKI
jgi:hypothetical protein